MLVSDHQKGYFSLNVVELFTGHAPGKSDQIISCSLYVSLCLFGEKNVFIKIS